jgi:hypothetical protein
LFNPVVTHTEDYGLAWIADFHLVVARGIINIEEHVFQGHVLHREAPLVQVFQPFCGLLDKRLGMRLIESMRFLF